jgi:hypothetical protein
MNCKLKLFSLFLIVATITAALAQTKLPDKPFQQWSKSEAEAVLKDSAWAIKQELRIKFDKERQTAAGSYSGVSSASAAQSATEVTSQVPVDFVFTLRLRSGLPIRQALVRLRNLKTDIEKMNAQQLASFDKQTEGLLECPACTDNYVVTLSCKSRNTPGADAVFSVFKGARLADLERYVFIANERGERRKLVHFAAPKVPGDEATFFFPRRDDKGDLLLTTENKELLINLSDNNPSSISNFRVGVASLIVNGKVEF